MDKLFASLKTFWKYLFWTAVAAVIDALIRLMSSGDLSVPIYMVPVVAAVLKSAATWVSLKLAEYRGE